MSTNKYQRFTVLLAIFLILVGLASLVGVSFFVLEHESPAAGTLLLLPILLVASACVLLYDYVHRRKLSRLATTFRFERSLYREALFYNCDYAYTVNLTQNKIHAVHRAGLLQPYHFRPDICYDDAIERVMQNLAPAMLFGDKDLYLAQHFLDAYQADKRVLSLEYHLKQENSYKQKSVFLTQNNITGDIFAFVALHDVTEKFRSEQKT